jgi:cell division protein FtsW
MPALTTKSKSLATKGRSLSPKAKAPAPARNSITPAAQRRKTPTPARILAPRLVFIASAAALLIFGLIMVYSASFVEGFTNPDIQDSSYIFRRQVMLAGIGFVALLVALVLDYRAWNSPLAWLPWAVVLALLILTWVMGNEGLGGRRWIDLFGLNLQPSEFAKAAVLLAAGMLLVRLREGEGSTALLLMIAACVGLPTLFILFQPDLGTALIVLAGIVAIAWFGELSLKPLAILGLLVVAVGVGAIRFAGFRTSRIDAWLDPWAHSEDAAYQIVNSFYALADGGVTGVGLGLSHQKYLYLPQPHNDLIFPIIGEELGLIGALLVVVLFLVFLLSAFLIARNAPDLYGRVVAGAAASMIGFQAFLNMLCMVNLLPMTGKPLPFFSAGGSSIIVTLILVGLILNVSLRSLRPDAADERRDQLLIINGGRTRQDERASTGLFGGLRPQPTQAKATKSKGRNPAPSRPAARPPTTSRPARVTQGHPATAPAPARNTQGARLRRPPAKPARIAKPARARQGAPTRTTTAKPTRIAKPARAHQGAPARATTTKPTRTTARPATRVRQGMGSARS